MLVLDENIPASQRQKLHEWRVRFRTIGVELANSGTKDENLIPVLHRLPNPTFLSLDRDFYRRRWTHATYCLVWLNVDDDCAADFTRRFLHHPVFNSNAKRMGVVARVHSSGVQYWKVYAASEISVRWENR